MNDKIDQLTSHIQERCLWQFFSRTWDREENIEGILSKATEILCGEHSTIETLSDKTYYADAKVLVSDFKRLFPWVTAMEKEEIKNVINSVKSKLKHITITGSHNEELNDPNY
jgi:vanadium nitrogenase delta subunit